MLHCTELNCITVQPYVQVTGRGPLTPGWQSSALSCTYKLLTVTMAGPDIYPSRSSVSGHEDPTASPH